MHYAVFCDTVKMCLRVSDCALCHSGREMMCWSGGLPLPAVTILCMWNIQIFLTRDILFIHKHTDLLRSLQQRALPIRTQSLKTGTCSRERSFVVSRTGRTLGCTADQRWERADRSQSDEGTHGGHWVPLSSEWPCRDWSHARGTPSPGLLCFTSLRGHCLPFQSQEKPRAGVPKVL